VNLTGGAATSFRARKHQPLSEDAFMAEVEKGDRVARGSEMDSRDKPYLAHLGNQWLVAQESRSIDGVTGNKYREADGSEVTQEHCVSLGYKRMLLERSNSPPTPVVRIWSEAKEAPVDIRVDNLPDDEEGQRLKNEYKARLQRFTNDVFGYMHIFATTGSPDEQGLGLVFVKPKSAVEEDESLTAQRDAVFDAVKGKGLQEYQYAVPAGYKLVPEKPAKKPRGMGKRFSSLYQPRWGRK
jgi:hypothetical protein